MGRRIVVHNHFATADAPPPFIATYKGSSIREESDGTFSVYVAGGSQKLRSGYATVSAAKASLDKTGDREAKTESGKTVTLYGDTEFTSAMAKRLDELADKESSRSEKLSPKEKSELASLRSARVASRDGSTRDDGPRGEESDWKEWKISLQRSDGARRGVIVEAPTRVAAVKKAEAENPNFKATADADEWGRFQITYTDSKGRRHTVEVHAPNAARAKAMFAETAEPGEKVVSVVADASTPAREMSRQQIEAELRGGEGSGDRIEALRTALNEKKSRNEDKTKDSVDPSELSEGDYIRENRSGAPREKVLSVNGNMVKVYGGASYHATKVVRA